VTSLEELEELSAALCAARDLCLAYNPNQPRWPRGTGKGGQWRDSGLTLDSDIFKFFRGNTPTPGGLTGEQQKQYQQAYRVARKEAKSKGKDEPTKAQISKHLPKGHPNKTVRKPKASQPKAEPKPSASKPLAIPTAPVKQQIQVRKPIEQQRSGVVGKLVGPWKESELEAKVESTKVSEKFIAEALQVADRKHLRRVLAAIDKVHEDGKLFPIMIRSADLGRSNGHYSRLEPGGDARGTQINDQIDINNSINLGHPTVTITHEIGHMIDFRLLNGDNGTYGSWSRAVKHWKDWRNAVYDSDAMRANEEMARSAPENRKYGAYLASEHETFARAYAQYIALRSGDPVLIENIDRWHGHQDYMRRNLGGRGWHTTWAWVDFEPIARSMDAIFAKEGLR
jgi:hypothetical protein